MWHPCQPISATYNIHCPEYNTTYNQPSIKASLPYVRSSLQPVLNLAKNLKRPLPQFISSFWGLLKLHLEIDILLSFYLQRYQVGNWLMIFQCPVVKLLWSNPPKSLQHYQMMASRIKLIYGLWGSRNRGLVKGLLVCITFPDCIIDIFENGWTENIW